MVALGKLAHEHGLLFHVDGARVFNAAIALGVDVKALAADADSLTFCLSKGLAAPVGSVVCGSKPFIAEARRARKAVGGAMRQVGVIAAAGIVALEQMVDRLAEDRANAHALAAGLAEIPGLQVEEVSVRTNIIYFETMRPDVDAPCLVTRLEEVRRADGGGGPASHTRRAELPRHGRGCAGRPGPDPRRPDTGHLRRYRRIECV